VSPPVVAVAAAGTGGHVEPALTVAAAMVQRGLEPGRIVFFGGDRYEAEAVPARGFPFAGFELVKLERTLTLRHLRIPLVVRRSAAAMAEELSRRRAGAVLAMSGYVTVPASLAARRLGIPLVLHEQNARPGLAARFAARRARATYLGLPGPAERLPRSEVVGNPIRSGLAAFDRAALRTEALHRYDLPEGPPVIGVMGGSLGAQVLNEAAAALVAGWDGPPVSVLHLTGKAAAGEMLGRAGGAPLAWRRLPFEDRMELFYAAADLVVCRAGAMTVSEVAATGSAAVFVPLERVGQQWNAAALADAGGGRLLPQAEIGRLPSVVRELVDDADARRAMSDAAAARGLPGAAGALAERVMGVLS
jgi:UDP-N-acetylglucosamine--N-acetylmuramyl-(pentapeptide) pyrophosphoryl-undecaprenol N-acetylglucosamine transferase